jgi:hypothetical protein
VNLAVPRPECTSGSVPRPRSPPLTVRALSQSDRPAREYRRVDPRVTSHPHGRRPRTRRASPSTRTCICRGGLDLSVDIAPSSHARRRRLVLSVSQARVNDSVQPALVMATGRAYIGVSPRLESAPRLLTPSAHALTMSTMPRSTRPGASPAIPTKPAATPSAAMPIAMARLPALFTASSSATPIVASRTPTTTKSPRVQTTSSVNCIATNGNDKINATPTATRTAGRLRVLYVMLAPG